MWHDAETVRGRSARLAELAAAAGRPVPSVSMLVLVNVDEDLERARAEVAAGLDGQYRLPLRAVDRWTAYGPAGRVAEALLAYRDAGVGEVLLLALSADPLAQYDRLAEVREMLGDGVACSCRRPSVGGDGGTA